MRLHLLRHARAASGGDPIPDASRPLTEVGRREASELGSWLAARPEPPRQVLCSSARRAVETMERVVLQLPAKPDTRVMDDLYLASAWKLFELVRENADPEVTTLLVVAHNPGIAELAASLAEHGDPVALRSLSRRFLPGSLAEIELPARRWDEIQPAGGTLVSHYTG